MDRELIRDLEITPYLPGPGPTFLLELYDEHRSESGKRVLSFDLIQIEAEGEETCIFERNQIHFPGIHSVDSEASLRAAVTFATLRPGPGGDDPECFVSYSERQLEFAETQAEHVAVAAFDALEVEI